jgi:phosphatidylserine/phosphatidylglycerophosphate/cardiolipin synthase-like enzyme
LFYLAATFHVFRSVTHLTKGENWYELAVRLEGDIVQRFLQYFFYYYHPKKGAIPSRDIASHPIQTTLRNLYPTLHYTIQWSTLPVAFLACGSSRSGSLPFAPIRATPTLFQIESIRRARRNIFIQTPNLNSHAIIKALKNALLKNIKVTICIPKNMMVLESIVTGWSTTNCCVTLLQRWALRRPETSLNVQWFKSDETQAFVVDGDKSHIKLMVVDEELVIVGSSNLDRASAGTSGEVNVAISNSEFAHQILAAIKRHQRTDFRSTEPV